MQTTESAGKTTTRISVDVDGIEDKLEAYLKAHGRPSKASVARAALEWALSDPDFMARVARLQTSEAGQATAAGA